MKVLIPLPAKDYDPTETGVSHAVLTEHGIEVVFATPDGQRAQVDELMVTGEGFDVWAYFKPLAKFKFIGLFLRANARGRAAHARMCESTAFQNPLRYGQLQVDDFDGVLIPGGHAPGMQPFLEDQTLQGLIVEFFHANKPVAAVCHGALLVARAIDPRTGQSVLHRRKTTALTWALEKKAWDVNRWLGRFWDRHYYRTYREAPHEPPGHCSVEAEIKRALADPTQFIDVPSESQNYFRKASGLFRDTPSDDRCAHVVVDGNYLSARWPGDVHTFANRLVGMLRT